MKILHDALLAYLIEKSVQVIMAHIQEGPGVDFTGRKFYRMGTIMQVDNV